MESSARNKELIKLGGLVRLSGLESTVKDPATLLGLLLRLKNEIKELNDDAIKKAKNVGFDLMQSRTEDKRKNTSKKPGVEKSYFGNFR